LWRDIIFWDYRVFLGSCFFFGRRHFRRFPIYYIHQFSVFLHHSWLCFLVKYLVLPPHRPSALYLCCRVPSRWIFSKSLIDRAHFFRAYKHSCRPQSGPLVVGLGQMSEDDGPGAVPLMSEQANFRQQLGHEDKTFLISTYCSRLKFRIGG